jgi:hypothetical protein
MWTNPGKGIALTVPRRPPAAVEACGRRAADRLRPYIGDMPVMSLVDDWRCWDQPYLDDELDDVDGPRAALDRLMRPISVISALADEGFFDDVAQFRPALAALVPLRAHTSEQLPNSWGVTARQWRLARL